MARPLSPDRDQKKPTVEFYPGENCLNEAPRAAYAYWRDIRGARDLPSFRDLDPAQIPRLLPLSAIGDVVPEPFDVRWKIVGQKIIDTLGWQCTGMSVRELMHRAPETIGATLECHQRACRDRRPWAISSSYQESGRARLHRELIVLPFSSDGMTVDRDWTVVHFMQQLAG